MQWLFFMLGSLYLTPWIFYILILPNFHKNSVESCHKIKKTEALSASVVNV